MKEQYFSTVGFLTTCYRYMIKKNGTNINKFWIYTFNNVTKLFLYFWIDMYVPSDYESRYL